MNARDPKTLPDVVLVLTYVEAYDVAEAIYRAIDNKENWTKQERDSFYDAWRLMQDRVARTDLGEITSERRALIAAKRALAECADRMKAIDDVAAEHAWAALADLENVFGPFVFDQEDADA